jgi:DNA polymerase elongation subunit (family B)
MNMLFRNETGNITKHLVYGIQDCIVLKSIIDRTDCIQTNFGMINLLKCLPFDTLFHNTTAQCLESYYLNQYRSAGFLVPFASRISEKVSYKGAYTWNSDRKIWLDGVYLSTDVNSEYPSAIRHL